MTNHIDFVNSCGALIGTVRLINWVLILVLAAYLFLEPMMHGQAPVAIIGSLALLAFGYVFVELQIVTLTIMQLVIAKLYESK